MTEPKTILLKGRLDEQGRVVLKAVGPYERKSQAMNAIVLALASLNPIPNKAAKVEEKETVIHLGDESPELTALRALMRTELKGMMPEQLRKKIAVANKAMEPMLSLMARIDAPCAKELEATLRREESEMWRIHAEVNG